MVFLITWGLMYMTWVRAQNLSKQECLFTIEPGIYIEEEKMGIRIENNFWITKNGNIDLMKNIPITAEEIERLMKRK
jgi:Xaa-Pro aminopeptidase